MLNRLQVSLVILAALAGAAQAQEAAPIKVGVSVGSLGNPFYLAAANGVKAGMASTGLTASPTVVSSDYDLQKQSSQVDSFISGGTKIIMMVPVDQKSSAGVVKRAKDKGVIVGSFDTTAPGADVSVSTDNVKAGEIACQYIVDHLGGKGNVIILNAEQVSAVVDRVNGCKGALAKAPGIKVLSDDQNSKGSRDGGVSVTLSLLTRFPDVQAMFAVNDPAGLGAELAAKQQNRRFIITSVDGAPDAVADLKRPDALLKATAAQSPYSMGKTSFELAYKILKGEKVETRELLLAPELITAENVGTYKGWDAK